VSEVIRTVVVPSVKLTERKLMVFKELEELYRQVLIELVDYGFRNNIDSFTRLKRDKYRELRGKFPQLPSPIFTLLAKMLPLGLKALTNSRRRV
jgi:putative transposase